MTHRLLQRTPVEQHYLTHSHVVRITGPSFAYFNISTGPIAIENLAAAEREIRTFADDHRATILAQRVFGAHESGASVASSPEKILGKGGWPLTWVQGYKRPVMEGFSIQTIAVSGPTAEPVRLDGKTVGFTFEDEDAIYCLLGNLSAAATGGNTEQALDLFCRAQFALRLAGLSFSNVVRTWFYIDEIPSWYRDFNRVRTAFFSERGVLAGLIPASTGKGTANATGKALVADVFAVKPKNQDVRVCDVRSPLQCGAPAYGSSFSRAVEVQHGNQRDLYISGTASIDPVGRTVYAGDTAKQIAHTIYVVEAILKSRAMAWAGVTRAVAYLRHASDKELLSRYLRQVGLPRFPLTVVAPIEICRSDLLFEIEVDAVALGS